MKIDFVFTLSNEHFAHLISFLTLSQRDIMRKSTNSNITERKKNHEPHTV